MCENRIFIVLTYLESNEPLSRQKKIIRTVSHHTNNGSFLDKIQFQKFENLEADCVHSTNYFTERNGKKLSAAVTRKTIFLQCHQALR